MRNSELDEAQVGIKIAGRNINNLRYSNNTTLMAEREEELKSLLMKVKEECAKAGLKLNIQKTRIMASGPITSWQIDGETMETVTDFIMGGSKITADGDCSHEIKRRLLLGRKVMTNLDSILKSRDYFASLVVQRLKRLPPMWETRVWSLGREDPLEKEMATHSSTLAWRIPWTEEPGRLQSMGLQRVRHDEADSLTELKIQKGIWGKYSVFPLYLSFFPQR